MEILDRIGVRKLFIRMGNVIGSWWNDLSNSIGEGWFNAKKYIFGIVGKAVDASVNFIGPAVVGMFNAISRGINAVTSFVVDKVASLVGSIPGLGDIAKKIAEFGKSIQIQETKFEPYQSGMTKEAAKMSKEGFAPSRFVLTDENYVRDRDAVVSDKQRRDRDSAAERKRETKGVTTPAPVPVVPSAATPASLSGQSPTYTPTNVSNNAPVSVRNNNPGNLRYYSRYAGPGGVLEGAMPGPEGSFAQFPSPEMGMAAMQRQLQLDTQSRGMTLTQFISKYAPPGDNNDTGAYIANMSRSLGIGPNDRIPSHLIPQLQSAMIRQEGGPAASNYYSGVQPGSGGSSFAFRPPSLMTVGMPGQYGGGSGGGAYNTGPIMSAAKGSFGQGDFTGSFTGTIDGPEQTYITNKTKLEQSVIDGIESRRASTTAYTGQDADSRLISLNSTSNEMESQNLVYQQQIATGVQKLNNQYDQQRKSLEMQFLGQIQSDVSRGIYKAIGGSQGFGVMGQQNSAFGSINQLYQSSFQNFATKILGKDMGPIYGNIFSQLAASYTDQFVNTVLGPMFGPNAAKGFNRAINNYAQGASVRKQYDVLKADYDKTKVDFDKLSSQVSLVDRLNALNPLTAKVGADKLQKIQQVDALEKLLGQKGQQVSQAKAAKDQNKKMVYEDLIYAMTGIPTGMRSLFGYEEGIQNFSQQMALMIGQPFSPMFGGGGGYEEYQRNVERQMKLGVDSQGRAMEQGAQAMLGSHVTGADYHNQGMGQVTNAHIMNYAQVTQMGLQGQAQIMQQHAQALSQMQFGGGAGGQSFMGMLFDKGVDFLAGSIFGGGSSTGGLKVSPLSNSEMSDGSYNYSLVDNVGTGGPGLKVSSTMDPSNPYSLAGSSSSGIGLKLGQSTTETTGFFNTISQGFTDVSTSIGGFFKDLFKPSSASPTGAGGAVPGYTGAGVPATRPAFSFGDMLAGLGGQFIGGKIGNALGIKGTSFGGMLAQAGINQTVGTVLGNFMKGQGLTTGLSNIPMAFANIGKGIFSPQIGIGNLISQVAGSKFMTNLAPGFAGSLGQFGSAFANPAIFGTAASGGTLSQLPTSQLLGSLGGAAMAGFSTYGLTNALSGGYQTGGNSLSKIAGIAGAANALGLFGAGTLGLTAGAGGLGGLFASGAGLLGTNPLGLAILGVAILGNRLFGRKAPETRSAGISGTLAEGSGTSLQNYKDIFQKGGKFSSDRSWSEYSAADPELVKYMQASVNDIFGGVREGARVMGIDPNAITGFSQQIKLNMLGMSQEDQAKTLMNSLKDFSDAMLKQAYPALAGFSLEAERLYETFTRLTQSTEFMNTAFEMLLYDAEDLAKTISGKTGLDLANLKYEIMTIFGGKDLQEQQDNFSKFVGDYYKLFYTQEEQLTFSLNQKKKEFEKIEEQIKTTITIPGLNVEIPEFKGTVEESRVAYRQFIDDYVKNTGLATEDQREIYAQLIQAAPMFYQGAQEFVALNQVQKKKKSREELIAEGTLLTGTFQEAAGSIGSGAFGGEFANTVSGVTSSLDYISSTLSNVPSGGIVPTETLGAGSQQFLKEQGNALIKAFEGGTNVNTVVDNSVRQVSSPITTFVMKDDKVRDFHPILRNTERSSLRAYTLAMR